MKIVQYVIKRYSIHNFIYGISYFLYRLKYFWPFSFPKFILKWKKSNQIHIHILLYSVHNSLLIPVIWYLWFYFIWLKENASIVTLDISFINKLFWLIKFYMIISNFSQKMFLKEIILIFKFDIWFPFIMVSVNFTNWSLILIMSSIIIFCLPMLFVVEISVQFMNSKIRFDMTKRGHNWLIYILAYLLMVKYAP